jgi:TonB family protein
MTQTQTLTSLYLAIGAALLLHIIILLALSYLPITSEEEPQRTVPTVTITNGSRASINSQESQLTSANASAANSYLATLEASTFKAQQEKTRERNNQRKATQKQQRQPLNQTQEPPTTSSNKKSQSSRAQKANQGMINIFKQKKITGETTQVSTTEYKELSNYEISLRSILSRAVFYDDFHRFMKAKDGNEINFEVTLILHPSGAIKNAIISRSGGIEEIDKLAKQVAFKASPYPRPPAEDMQNGFRYTIPITQKASPNN